MSTSLEVLAAIGILTWWVDIYRKLHETRVYARESAEALRLADEANRASDEAAQAHAAAQAQTMQEVMTWAKTALDSVFPALRDDAEAAPPRILKIVKRDGPSGDEEETPAEPKPTGPAG